MLEDKALEDPWSREAKLIHRRFRVPFLFSQDRTNQTRRADRRGLRLQKKK